MAWEFKESLSEIPRLSDRTHQIWFLNGSRQENRLEFLLEMQIPRLACDSVDLWWIQGACLLTSISSASEKPLSVCTLDIPSGSCAALSPMVVVSWSTLVSFRMVFLQDWVHDSVRPLHSLNSSLLCDPDSGF